MNRKLFRLTVLGLTFAALGCDANPNGPSAPSAPPPGTLPLPTVPEQSSPKDKRRKLPLRQVGQPIGMVLPESSGFLG